jgi:Tol biopolymer transport system component
VLIGWDIFDSDAQEGFTYRMNTGGAAMTLLTGDPAVPGCPQHPAFSPDGNKLTFADGTYCDTQNPSNIWVSAANGSAPNSVANGYSPDWGPKP